LAGGSKSVFSRLLFLKLINRKYNILSCLFAFGALIAYYISNKGINLMSGKQGRKQVRKQGRPLLPFSGRRLQAGSFGKPEIQLPAPEIFSRNLAAVRPASGSGFSPRPAGEPREPVSGRIGTNQI
jgi:hypothetical protein